MYDLNEGFCPLMLLNAELQCFGSKFRGYVRPLITGRLCCLPAIHAVIVITNYVKVV